MQAIFKGRNGFHDLTKGKEYNVIAVPNYYGYPIFVIINDRIKYAYQTFDELFKNWEFKVKEVNK